MWHKYTLEVHGIDVCQEKTLETMGDDDFRLLLELDFDPTQKSPEYNPFEEGDGYEAGDEQDAETPDVKSEADGKEEQEGEHIKKEGDDESISKEPAAEPIAEKAEGESSEKETRRSVKRKRKKRKRRSSDSITSSQARRTDCVLSCQVVASSPEMFVLMKGMLFHVCQCHFHPLFYLSFPRFGWTEPCSRMTRRLDRYHEKKQRMQKAAETGE